jgi:thiol-disulfide isomerase/thioredoxin
VRSTILLFTLTACASSQHVVVSVRNLACVECAGELEERATHLPGVRTAKFDRSKVELDLEVAPGTATQPILDELQKEPLDGKKLEALLGPGKGSFVTFEPFEAGWDAKILSQHGEDVSGFEPAQGKVTLVDFSAEWCGPCHQLDEQIHAILRASPGTLAYRRMNIVDWDSALAKHWLAGASELPYLIVLDPHGKEVARIAGNKPDELKAAIAKGAQ